jgi:hypothetical protein
MLLAVPHKVLLCEFKHLQDGEGVLISPRQMVG